MAFLSIHTMEGDPDDLLARKRRQMTSKTASGIITVNLWATAEGAAAFSQNQEALQAQHPSRLPTPATFERFPHAEYTLYGHE
jgi:hypothetical protein